MEIERKFLIDVLPPNLEACPRRTLEQAYLCTDPVVRIRRSDDHCTLTYKSSGLMVREEYNLPLTDSGYEHLLEKADGNIIRKTRYLIPLDGGLTCELDVFSKPFEMIRLAEVEFASEDEALAFSPPEWFGEEVTMTAKYHNSTLSQASPEDYR